MLAKNFLLISIVLNFSCVMGFGADDDPDIEAIEAEFTKKKDDVKSEPTGKKETGGQVESGSTKEAEESIKEEPARFSDLSKMIPFSEISVIQRKFLPKTNRFQLHLGGNLLSNNPFYDTIGLVGRLAFNFTESIGLEASAISFNRAPKYVTEDLKDIHGVLTSSLVSATSYYGMDLVLTPFYGKITWLDERIIPYDFYLSLGAGMTSLTDVKDPASTIHVAAGQIYALTKNFVARWDLSVNSYQAQVPDVTNTGTITNKHVQNFRDVFLGGGISFLFPGAGYR